MRGLIHALDDTGQARFPVHDDEARERGAATGLRTGVRILLSGTPRYGAGQAEGGWKGNQSTALRRRHLFSRVLLLIL